MNATVILVAYHGDDWLPDCLKSLAKASRRRLHLVLVDNSGNSAIDALDTSPFDAEIIETPRPMGFAEANNYALVHAEALRGHVLFLNQDTLSPSGWIDACVECLQQNIELAAVSPLVRKYDDDGWDPSFLDCIGDEVAAGLDAGIDDDVVVVKNVPAPALLVRTDVLRMAGPFDPVFGSYYEDYDLCRRIRKLGYSLGFCTRARIRHFSGGSTSTRAQERRRMRQIIRNRTLYLLRESEGMRWWRGVRFGVVDFPRRLMRGLVGTPSSQPPVVTLQAYGDLLQIIRRVLSRSYDERQWYAYLDELDWPPRQNHRKHVTADRVDQ